MRKILTSLLCLGSVYAYADPLIVCKKNPIKGYDVICAQVQSGQASQTHYSYILSNFSSREPYERPLRVVSPTSARRYNKICKKLLGNKYRYVSGSEDAGYLALHSIECITNYSSLSDLEIKQFL